MARRRRLPVRPHTTASEWPPAVARAIEARSRGRCEARLSEACRGIGEHKHHRKLASQGGPSTPVNGLHVCFICHVQAHGQLYGRAIHRGVILPAWVNNDEIPEFVPFTAA